MSMTPGAVRLLAEAVDRAEGERRVAHMQEMRAAMHADPKGWKSLIDKLHRIVSRRRG